MDCSLRGRLQRTELLKALLDPQSLLKDENGLDPSDVLWTPKPTGEAASVNRLSFGTRETAVVQWRPPEERRRKQAEPKCRSTSPDKVMLGKPMRPLGGARGACEVGGGND